MYVISDHIQRKWIPPPWWKSYALYDGIFSQHTTKNYEVMSTVINYSLFLLTRKAVNVYPEPDPLIGMEHLEFYGQRAWRPGKLSAEPPDPDKEKLGIVALQYQEKHLVNHSVSEVPFQRKEIAFCK